MRQAAGGCLLESIKTELIKGLLRSAMRRAYVFHSLVDSGFYNDGIYPKSKRSDVAYFATLKTINFAECR